jgi:hypothetical protein
VTVFKWTQHRELSRAGAWVCLVLMMSIFSWGIGYKLDQYGPPHSAVHKLPKAKLLSKNEHTWIADSAQSSPELAPAVALSSTHAAFHFAGPPSSERGLGAVPIIYAAQRAERLKQPFLLMLNHLFVRPPPVQA